MQFFDGFLFGLGLIASFLTWLFVFIYLLKKLKKKHHAKVSDWRKYYDEAVKEQNFEEAAYVLALIANKKETDEIITPKNYEVKSIPDIVFEKTEDSVSKLRVKKTFKIIKIKGNGD